MRAAFDRGRSTSAYRSVSSSYIICNLGYIAIHVINNYINQGRAEGRAEGREQGIQALVEAVRDFTQDRDAAIQRLIRVFSLSPDSAAEKVAQYWT